MDKCVPIAPDWLMCWTVDLEVWFRNLTASFFFLLLGQTLKSCGASLLSWTSEKVDKLQGGLTCNGLSSWKSNALLHSVSRETGINFSSGSLTLWGFGSLPPPLYTLLATTDLTSVPAENHVIPPKHSPTPFPLVIVPLKFPFILQKRIEEHRSSTAPVGCHVAAGVFHPLEWSPCVFVHHTQLDPGTHGSTAPQLPILIKFASFVFLLILIGFGVLYLPWLLGWPGIFQLYLCSFGVSLMQNIVFYCIPCGDPLNWWLMR